MHSMKVWFWYHTGWKYIRVWNLACRPRFYFVSLLLLFSRFQRCDISVLRIRLLAEIKNLQLWVSLGDLHRALRSACCTSFHVWRSLCLVALILEDLVVGFCCGNWSPLLAGQQDINIPRPPVTSIPAMFKWQTAALVEKWSHLFYDYPRLPVHQPTSNDCYLCCVSR